MESYYLANYLSASIQLLPSVGTRKTLFLTRIFLDTQPLSIQTVINHGKSQPHPQGDF